MTDMKPGSQWLLPVRFEDYAVPKVGRYILPNGMDVLLTGGDLAGIIPADRITELEAEVARLRALLARTIPAGRVIGEFYDPPVPENEIVLECWLTWGTLRDIRAALDPAPSEKEAG